MKKCLFLFLIAGALHGQSSDLDRYIDRFYRNSDISPQNFSLSSLEDILVSRGLLFGLEVLTIEINNESPEDLVKKYGMELYGDFTNYTELYGRSSAGAPFLVQLGLVRMYQIPFVRAAEAFRLAALAKEDLSLAIGKDGRSFDAHLALGRLFLTLPSHLGGSLTVSSEYFSKALAFADTPAQRYQGYVWQAILLKKQGKAEEAQKALASAEEIYPTGSFHRYAAGL